jgi:AAA domain
VISTLSNDFDWRGNPLLQGLPKIRTPEEICSALESFPYDPQMLRKMPTEDRIVLSRHAQKSVVISDDLFQIQIGIQRMWVDGLVARDPRHPQLIGTQFGFAQDIRSCNQLSDLQWRESFCGGMLIEGDTGTGKSFAVDTLLSQWPTVVHHKGSSELPWSNFKQLIYLKVPMPADGSRKGLIDSIFMGMDNALGTQYLNLHRAASWSVERLLIRALYYLTLHCTGVLIIEEAQHQNLAGTFGREFLTFFLRILNYGIPVVIIGNPAAFVVIKNHGQDLARFSEYGGFRLSPILDHSSTEWTTQWVPGLWRPCVTSEPDGSIENLSEILWRYTGGFPRFLARLRRESEIAALLNGSESVELQHIEMGYHSAAMRPVQPLIEAFVCRSPSKLQKFRDVDHSYYVSEWSSHSSSQAGPADGSHYSGDNIESPSDGRTKVKSKTQTELSALQTISKELKNRSKGRA